MCFDGSHAIKRERPRIVFTSSQGESLSFSYRLEFECTNNIAEYKALLLGLELARDMKIKILQIVGDSDLVVMQVKG